MSDSHPKSGLIRMLLIDDHATVRQGLRYASLGQTNGDGRLGKARPDVITTSVRRLLFRL